MPSQFLGELEDNCGQAINKQEVSAAGNDPTGEVRKRSGLRLEAV